MVTAQALPGVTRRGLMQGERGHALSAPGGLRKRLRCMDIAIDVAASALSVSLFNLALFPNNRPVWLHALSIGHQGRCLARSLPVLPRQDRQLLRYCWHGWPRLI